MLFASSGGVWLSKTLTGNVSLHFVIGERWHGKMWFGGMEWLGLENWEGRGLGGIRRDCFFKKKKNKKVRQGYEKERMRIGRNWLSMTRTDGKELVIAGWMGRKLQR